jgi:hypothetical protein
MLDSESRGTALQSLKSSKYRNHDLSYHYRDFA